MKVVQIFNAFIKVFMNTNAFEMYLNTNMNTLHFTEVFKHEYAEKCIQVPMKMNINRNTPGLPESVDV